MSDSERNTPKRTSTGASGKGKNKARVDAIFISDKMEFRPKRIKWLEEACFIMLMNIFTIKTKQL